MEAQAGARKQARDTIGEALGEFVDGLETEDAVGGVLVGYVVVFEFARMDGERCLSAIGPEGQPSWYGRMYANELLHKWPETGETGRIEEDDEG